MIQRDWAVGHQLSYRSCRSISWSHPESEAFIQKSLKWESFKIILLRGVLVTWMWQQLWNSCLCIYSEQRCHMAEPQLYKAACQACPCVCWSVFSTMWLFIIRRSAFCSDWILCYCYCWTNSVMTLKCFRIHATGFFICSLKFKLPEFQLPWTWK